MCKNIIKKLGFSNQTSVISHVKFNIRYNFNCKNWKKKKKYHGILVSKIFILEYENMEYDA